MARKKKDDATKVDILSKWLPVKLTRLEVAERGQTMAQRVKEKVELEAEKASVMRGFGEKLKAIGGEINRLSKIVADGEEYRNVDCEVIRSFIDKKVIITRKDTGEVIEERKMFQSEMQGEIPFPADVKQDDLDKIVDPDFEEIPL